MARGTRPNEKDYSFGVEKISIKLDREATGWWQLRRTDRPGKAGLLGVAKDNYSIVKNSDLVAVARKAFRALKVYKGCEENLFVTRGGSRFYGEYTFKTRTIKVPEVGDTIGLRLTLNNSYDRSCRVGFSMGFIRLICKNGMVTNSRDFDFNRLHSFGKISAKVSIGECKDSIEKAFNSFDADNLEVFGDMAAKKVNQTKGGIIIDNMAVKVKKASPILSQSDRDSIKMIWDNPIEADKDRNLFNLYNAATSHLTHAVSGERFEHATETSKKIFGRFEKLVQNPSEFISWSEPFPEKTKAQVNVEA